MFHRVQFQNWMATFCVVFTYIRKLQIFEILTWTWGSQWRKQRSSKEYYEKRLYFVFSHENRTFVMYILFKLIFHCTVLKENIHNFSLNSYVPGEHYDIYVSFNPFLARGDFCHLLIAFSNSLDLDKNWHSVGPDLDLNLLDIHIVFLKEFFFFFFEKVSRRQQKHAKLPIMQRAKVIWHSMFSRATFWDWEVT